MNAYRNLLWVSSLALLVFSASCGTSNVGSPIPENEDAYVQDNSPNQEELAADDGQGDGQGDGSFFDVFVLEEEDDASEDPEAVDEGDKGASYTPGAPLILAAGITNPSILGYGWKGGAVTEGAAPDWIKLTTTVKGKPAWIGYQMKELVIGRLKNIKIIGAGSGMQVYMYNWRTATWNSFGIYNLSAGIANIPVAVEYAPNGVSFLMLVEPAIGGTRIDKIETTVL
jgi:hypothetical protein